MAPTIRAIFVAVTAALLPAQSNLANAERPRDIHLPPQSLSSSLIELGRARDISIVFASEMVEGIAAPKVDGKLSTKQAITKLLKDTNIEPRISKNGVITLHKEEPIEAIRPDQYRQIEEVSVIGRRITGSRLRRTGIEGSSPVDIITAPKIAETGAQGIGELLKFLPAVSGNSTSTAIGNGGNGTSTVTLRGLPASNTLVLINGKRAANNGYAGKSFDLNSIPPALVDSIEILKSGGSAVYGSDAIAGVVNIRLKDDFQGLQIDQYYGQTSRGDLDTSTTSLLWGQESNQGNIIVHLSHFEQEPIFSRDRELSSTADGRRYGGTDGRASATNPGQINLADSSTLTFDSDNQQYRPVGDTDFFNFFDYTSSQSESRRSNAYIATNYEINKHLQLHSELAYSQTDSTIVLAPTPIYTAFSPIDLTVSKDNIYNPFDEDIHDLRYRLTEAGTRDKQNQTTSYRYSFDLNGSSTTRRWSLNWNWSQVNSQETQIGLFDAYRVQKALGDSSNCINDLDGCVPLDLFSGSIDQTQLDYIKASTESNGHSRLSEATAILEQDFFTPGGAKATILAGISVRKESISFSPSNQSLDTIIVGGGQAGSAKGKRRITEGFFELYMPLLREKIFAYQLDLEIAARHSQYSDFGKNTSPKISIKYRPIENLLVRTSYTEGFRAPSLQELHKASEGSYLSLVDPCSNSLNIDSLPGCSAVSDASLNQFLTIHSGNPNLQAEIAQTYALGLVWTPHIIQGLHLSIDYFTIHQDSVVGSSGQFVVNQSALYDRFSELIERDVNGNIKKIHAPNLNIGRRQVSGWDFQLEQRWRSKRWGNFKLAINGSNIRKYLYQVNPEQDRENQAGTFSDEASEGNGALPEWKISSGLSWQKKQWRASYNVYYISSLKETFSNSNITREAGSWSNHNIQLSFKASSALKITLGIDNLWDTPPPFLDSAFNDNYDARTYDVKGRYWYTRLNYSFL